MLNRINLLAISVFIVLGLFFAVVARPSGDTYWHLAIGRQVSQEKAIPKVDKFVYGPERKNFTSTEWLAGLTYYISYKNLDYKGIILIRIVLSIITVFFLFKSISLFSKDNVLNLAAICAVSYSMSFRLLDRPELFSYALLSFINYLCLSYWVNKQLPKSSYVLVPVIFLLWPNLHGFTVFGLVILLFYLFLSIARKIKGKGKWPQGLAIVTTVSMVLSLAQYQKVFSFFFLAGSGKESAEWAPLAARIFWTKEVGFFNQISWPIYVYLSASIVYLTLAFFFIRKKTSFLEFTRISFYLCLLLLPIRAYRLIPVSMVLSAPIVVLMITGAIKTSSLFANVHRVIFSIMLAMIVLSILTKYPPGLREDITIDTMQGEIYVSYRFWTEPFPDRTTKIIQENLNTKRLFTEAFWNNYFIWKIQGITTFSDTNYEIKSNREKEDENAIRTGGESWQKLLEDYDIDTVVNGKINTKGTTFVPVYKLPGWKLIFVDGTSVLYAREDVIKRAPVDLSAIEPYLDSPTKFKPGNAQLAITQLNKLLEFDPKNDFARTQLGYYLEKDSGKKK